MAARLTKRVTENHRKSIQVSMLINSLTDHVLRGTEMKATQVDSAKYLISQGIGAPTSQTELNVDGSVTVELVRFSPDKAPE